MRCSRTRNAIDRYAYLPLGAGQRICIGASFALQEATLALATILKNFTLELVPGHVVWPLQRVTLRPQHGLRMIVHSRVTDAVAAEQTAAATSPTPQLI